MVPGLVASPRMAATDDFDILQAAAVPAVAQSPTERERSGLKESVCKYESFLISTASYLENDVLY